MADNRAFLRCHGAWFDRFDHLRGRQDFRSKPVRLIIDAYIEIIRNTPFLVQIFFIFFGLPSAGLRLSPNSAALLALVVNFGAYGTEIIRAGIRSIHKGQVEAGTALGLQAAGLPLCHHETGFADSLSFAHQPVYLSDADFECSFGHFGE